MLDLMALRIEQVQIERVVVVAAGVRASNFAVDQTIDAERLRDLRHAGFVRLLTTMREDHLIERLLAGVERPLMSLRHGVPQGVRQIARELVVALDRLNAEHRNVVLRESCRRCGD
jgi:hypothetical protein